MLAGIAVTAVSVLVDVAGIEVCNFRIGLLLEGAGAQRLPGVWRDRDIEPAGPGIFQQAWRWEALNYLALPLIGMPLVGVVWLLRRRHGLKFS
jgi:hypothetical protein